MVRLLVILALVFSYSCLGSQTIPEQMKEILETPDTITIELKVWAPHYYLDSNDIIEDYLGVRQEIEFYMLERLPNLYPNRDLEFYHCPDRNNSRDSSFVNTGQDSLPVSFRYRIFEKNTQFNPTDKDKLTVYYYHCFRAILRKE